MLPGHLSSDVIARQTSRDVCPRLGTEGREDEGRGARICPLTADDVDLPVVSVGAVVNGVRSIRQDLVFRARAGVVLEPEQEDELAEVEDKDYGVCEEACEVGIVVVPGAEMTNEAKRTSCLANQWQSIARRDLTGAKSARYSYEKGKRRPGWARMVRGCRASS